MSAPGKYEIAYSVQVTPVIRVEVDEFGQVRLAMRTHRERTDAEIALGVSYNRVHSDGHARGDVSNVSGLQDALGDAQLFAQVVFPSGTTPAESREFTWQERRDAYNALRPKGKVDWKAAGRAATVLTEFLREYGDAERIADEGHRPHMTLAEYADQWEQW